MPLIWARMAAGIPASNAGFERGRATAAVALFCVGPAQGNYAEKGGREAVFFCAGAATETAFNCWPFAGKSGIRPAERSADPVRITTHVQFAGLAQR